MTQTALTTKKLDENSTKSLLRAAAAVMIAGLTVSACATTQVGESQSTGNIYAGADRLYLNNYVRGLPDREVSPNAVSQVVLAEQTPRNEAWLLASYSGVEGARLAHEMFDKTEAEKLDGACERYVKISNDETLWDISEYCDVSLTQLMTYNPSLHSPRFVSNGQIIEIPGGGVNLSSGGILRGAMAAKLAQFYSVQPGDNLNKIAFTFGASATEIANLNPSVNWSVLPVGQKLVIPIGAGVGAAGPAYPGTAYRGDESLDASGYSEPSYHDDSAPYATSGSIVAAKPYQMKPVPDSLRGSELTSGDPYPSISVRTRYVAPGGKVTLTGKNLPENTDITISRGRNGRTMNNIDTVRTDEHGSFSTEVKAPVKSDPGGVIFGASPADGAEKHLSDRVGVKVIDDDE